MYRICVYINNRSILNSLINVVVCSCLCKRQATLHMAQGASDVQEPLRPEVSLLRPALFLPVPFYLIFTLPYAFPLVLLLYLSLAQLSRSLLVYVFSPLCFMWLKERALSARQKLMLHHYSPATYWVRLPAADRAVLRLQTPSVSERSCPLNDIAYSL